MESIETLQNLCKKRLDWRHMVTYGLSRKTSWGGVVEKNKGFRYLDTYMGVISIKSMSNH